MERRGYERTESDLPVKYFCENSLYKGTARNVSENGMFISTVDFLPCGNTVEIQMALNRTYLKIDLVAKIAEIMAGKEESRNRAEVQQSCIEHDFCFLTQHGRISDICSLKQF